MPVRLYAVTWRWPVRGLAWLLLIVLVCAVGVSVVKWIVQSMVPSTKQRGAESELSSFVDVIAAHHDLYGECPLDLSDLYRGTKHEGGATRVIDPWGSDYIYERTSTGYVIRSLGPDRKMGTPDDLVREGGFPGRSRTDE